MFALPWAGRCMNLSSALTVNCYERSTYLHLSHTSLLSVDKATGSAESSANVSEKSAMKHDDL